MRRWWLGLLGAVIVTGALPPSALGDPAPFGQACATQSDGIRFCSAGTNRVPSWDGVPLDVDVTLPPSSFGNGPFPTIVMLHGWGGKKTDFESTDPAGGGPVTYHYNNDYYASQGYAVLNYTHRGFGNSCGGGAPKAQTQTGACQSGFIRLGDQRYEARDAQFLLGSLVDQGVAKAGALGTTGISYGGGLSMELAYLHDRIRQPNGSFVPWTSPNGTPLSIMAAWPRWPWSDLISSLLPNGRFLDFDPRTDGLSRTPFGVELQSYVDGLFALGAATGYYEPPAPVGDPRWDLTTNFAIVSAGEPAGPNAQSIADETFNFHQAYGMPLSASGVAPLLIENGWTDDLFPPEQALRVYNDLKAGSPSTPVTLQFGDLGHSRGSNKATVNRAFNDQGAAFFAAYLTGSGTPPAAGSVTAFTQTCPSSIPDGGPYSASSWSALSKGVVSLGSALPQTILSTGGDPKVAANFDPIAATNPLGTGDACKTIPVEQEPGTATYQVVSQGFTLLGLPTVHATVSTAGPFGELISRLWDVAPDGTQRLISRGVYRLADNQTGDIVVQLHGNGYHFDAGHTVQLELLGRDAPYLRASNGTFVVTVSNVTVDLPTAEAPNGGQITNP